MAPAGNWFNSFVGQLAVARGQRDTISHKSTQRHLLKHTQLRRKRFQEVREKILNTANDRIRNSVANINHCRPPSSLAENVD
jgi:hypothetical protein